MSGFNSGFNIPAGMTFSPLISAIYNGDSLNIFANQLWEKQLIFPSICCYPSTDFSVGSIFSMNNSGYDYLLNPQVAINQVSQQWQNGGGFWGGTSGAGGFTGAGSATSPFFQGGQFQFPWQAPVTQPGGGSSTGKSQADKDLAMLKDIYEKLNKASQNDGSRFMQEYEEEYKEAMKLKTSQEKVDALKKIIEKIDSEYMQNAVFEDKDIKTSLIKLGFKFPDTKAFETENKDDLLKDAVKKLKNALESHSINNIDPQIDAMIMDGKVLAGINAWYKENPKKSIIKEIVKLLPETTYDEQTAFTNDQGPILKICEALKDKAGKFNNREISKQVKALNKALAVINDAVKDNNTVTQADFDDVAKAFDKLYVLVRLAEAAKIDKEIQEKYKYLNEINDGAIPADMVTEATKKSLESDIGALNVPQVDIKDDEADGENAGSADGSEIVVEEENEEPNTAEKKKLSPKELADAVYQMIDGPSDELDYPIVDEYISSKHLNKNNIVEFLTAFYAHGSYEGIIEYLDDEHDNGIITMKNKMNIIESLIAKAKEKSLAGDSRVKKLEQILKLYKGEKYKDCEDFNHGGEWCDFSQGFWRGVASIFGDTTTHNEIIDKLMKSLWVKLKNE